MTATEAPSRAAHLSMPDAAPAARILGVGTAVPATSYSQRELLEEFHITDPKVRSIFLNSAIDRRGLTLPPRQPDGSYAPESQGDLLRKHTTQGLAMGRQAIEACLADIGAGVPDIRHLTCVTSTGFLAPGFSALLIRDMGIDRHCSRLDVVGMGCNAGLNALAAVAGWATAHPDELALMVCIEACSATYVFDGTMRTSVVNSLFGDGAAAVAVGAPSAATTHHGAFRAGVPSSPGGAAPALVRFSSCIITDAIRAMRYDWDDDNGKFSFYLDAEVPYVVGAHAELALERLLRGTGLRPSDIAHWLVHSGGKKVIDSVRANLGLSRYDLRHTTGVLRDHGNLSSGSFLFSYQRLRAEGRTAAGDFGVLMTMGPGSSIEMALARW